MDINWFDADYLPWLIPVIPFLSFALITLAAGRSKRLSHTIGVGSVLLSFVMAWAVFFNGTLTEDFGKKVYGSDFTWMDLGEQAFQMGVLVDPLTAAMLFMVGLAILMIFIYTIGYMSAYPDDDPHQIRYSRFFAYLSLFAGGMFTLVVADNLLLLFIGWEIMGLCSYLLIGFLIEKKSAYQAAVKAFMTTRIADVIMLIGIGYLYAETGTLNFRAIMYNEEVLNRLGNVTEVEAHGEESEAALVEGETAAEGEEATESAIAEGETHNETLTATEETSTEDETGFLGLSAAAIIGACLVIGTIGKSAQFPLHAWLPDAMEGPTPVSAMIHAAAMVSAGVYAVIRVFPLLEAGGNPHHGEYTLPLIMMGVIGATTALGAAILGIGQNDIKRVLAYSTISQLGFMVAALGIGAYIAAAFHLITHAFFKALLFMSSGAVIHAMEHGEHHLLHAHGHGGGHDPEHADEAHGHAEHHTSHHGHDEHEEIYDYYAVPHRVQPGEKTPYGNTYLGPDGQEPTEAEWTAVMPDGIREEFVATPNDIRLMGGLVRNIPVTAYAMLAGALSLSGLPLISAGFWSKDEIIADAFLFVTEPSAFEGGGAPWLHIFVFFMLVISATITAFYTMRMWLLTFTGDYRSAMAEHATLKNHVEDEHGHTIEDPDPSDFPRWWAVYRNSFFMQLPLVILAFFAITAGWVGIHEDFWILQAFTGSNNFFKNFVGGTLLEKPVAPPFSIVPVLFSIAAFSIGAFGAYVVYGTPQKAGEKDPAHKFLGDGVWMALQKRFYFDRLWLGIFYVPFDWFARKVAYIGIDKESIDWFLHVIGDIFTNIGEALKRINYVVIDGVGDGIPALIASGGRWFRNIQSGRVQQYLFFTAIMILAIGLFFILQVV